MDFFFRCYSFFLIIVKTIRTILWWLLSSSMVFFYCSVLFFRPSSIDFVFIALRREEKTIYYYFITLFFSAVHPSVCPPYYGGRKTFEFFINQRFPLPFRSQSPVPPPTKVYVEIVDSQTPLHIQPPTDISVSSWDSNLASSVDLHHSGVITSTPLLQPKGFLNKYDFQFSFFFIYLKTLYR